MRERFREKRKGLYISMPGLVTVSFLDEIAKVAPLPERENDLPTKRARPSMARNYIILNLARVSPSFLFMVPSATIVRGVINLKRSRKTTK